MRKPHPPFCILKTPPTSATLGHILSYSYQGSNTQTMAKLTLIDGSGFIFRAFHALPPLRRPDGVQVGAVYGFCTMILKSLLGNKPEDSLVVVFDAGRQTF